VTSVSHVGGFAREVGPCEDERACDRERKALRRELVFVDQAAE
jgi:hypothetical protein